MRFGTRSGPFRFPARAKTTVAALCCALAVAGCDNVMKWVPFFSTMTEQPSVETYENEPRPPVEGTIPVGGEYLYGVAEDGRLEATLTLQEADTLSPPTSREPDLGRGQEGFIQFCTPCHGPRARGNGPVVGPNRIPPVPMLDLLSERAAGFSDGYIFGLITVGRGLMPSYRRIEPARRWDIVAYVRSLQSGEAPAGGTGAAVPDTATASDTGTGEDAGRGEASPPEGGR